MSFQFLDDPTAFGAYLKRICRERRLTQEQVADHIGVNRTTISNWFRGFSVPSHRNMQQLIELLELDLTDLELSKAQDESPKIPIFSVDAGYDYFFGDEGYETGVANKYFDKFHSDDPNAFCCQLHGNSMEPEFQQGHIVLIEPSREVRARDYVVFSAGDIKSFKQYVPLGDGRVKFHPLNPEYEDVIVIGTDIRYLWKVVMVFNQC